MNTVTVSAVVCIALMASVVIGRVARRFLPDSHFSSDSKDAIRLAVGVVITMTALLLGLLIASAKNSYDTERGEVLQLAAKIAFLDRVMANYGEEAVTLRGDFHKIVRNTVSELWRDGESTGGYRLDTRDADAFYARLEALAPRDEFHRSLKTQAIATALELGRLRALVYAQSVPSVPRVMFWIVVAWLVLVFLTFGLLAPPNATATISCLLSATAVAGALFLILELDHPFTGIMPIPQEPLTRSIADTDRASTSDTRP